MSPGDKESISSHKDHAYIALHPEESEHLNPPESKNFDSDDSTSQTTQSQTLPDYWSNRQQSNDLTVRLLSALFYAICSFMITVINKIVLTTYSFPSPNILGIGQAITTILILRAACSFRAITIRRLSMLSNKIWILAFLYLGNLMSGLAGTKNLPLPMFTVLRRFCIVMTVILEYILLGVRQSTPILFTIFTMILGSFVAAASDLTFNAIGYTQVMTSNLFSAANGVYIKKTTDSKEISKHELLYYNALLTVLPLILISSIDIYTTDRAEGLIKFNHWDEFGFVISFLASCTMGYLLMYSTVLCTHYNSALTTTIIGTIKVSIR